MLINSSAELMNKTKNYKIVILLLYFLFYCIQKYYVRNKLFLLQNIVIQLFEKNRLSKYIISQLFG